VLKRNIKWSKKKIKQKILMLKEEGEFLSPSHIQQNFPRLFSAAVRTKYFNSWRNALEACDLEPDEEYKKYRNRGKKQKWTKEVVINKIQSFSVDNLSTVYRNYKGLYSASYRLFGSWIKALKAAGRYKEYKNHRKNIVIKKIKKFHQKHGKKNVFKFNKKLYYQVYNEFGSWKKGLKEAGLL
jgi:hypothetical protein